MTLVSLYMYTIPPPKTSHSFYVANEIGGYSPCLKTYLISSTTTFTQLRERIEMETDRGLQRHTIAYIELRNNARLCHNWHDYPEERVTTHYRFGTRFGGTKKNTRGFLEVAVGGNVPPPPLVICEDVEDEPILEIVGTEREEIDLVVIPVTQIRPSDDVVTCEKNRL
eukprot:CAMPEP_0172497096 /NCGR_PEP_ID=MMETSP1066-20121228/95155_1 /TAXON_ID=671091 /ORGANISM="Coscinodiscus wailesii, Strain CCMP2513" /LENGTH=167 /DNA_ID=CAMNT_0013269689 /DNA_START=99 /DNA_END=602 /DNA_ORIENTATION=-